MTVQPFTLSWMYSKSGSAPVVDEAGLSALTPKGADFVKQLKASLKAQTLYSRGAMLTSLSLLAACGGGGGGGTPAPTPTPTPNQAPTVEGDKTLAGTEDMDVSLDITTLPSDPDGDALTVSAVVEPMNGDILVGGTLLTDPSQLTESNLDTLSYRPDADFNGTDTFSYTVNDGNGGTATQVITVEVAGVNDEPVLGTNAAVTTNEDTRADLNFAVPTDVDGDTLTITIDELPTNGSLFIGSGTTAVIAGQTLTAAEFANLEFAPTANVNGASGQLVYTVTDGNGGSQSQTIAFSITAQPDAPTLPADSTVTVAEDTTTPTSLGLETPTDPDGDTLTNAAIDAAPAAGEGVVRVAGTTTALMAGDMIPVTDLQNLEFIPAADFDGDATFTYTVADGTGQSSSQTVTLSVTGSSDSPVAQADKSVSADLDTSANLNITAPTDPDTGDTLTITVTQIPTEGGIFRAGETTALAVDDVISLADITGLQFVTEASDDVGGAGTFAYQVSDAENNTDTQEITLSITSSTFDLTGGGGDVNGQGGALNGSNGFEVTGPSGDIGISVSGGGDFNNDGLSDIAIANPEANVFLIFGGAVTTGGIFDPIVGLNTINASNGQTFSGTPNSDFGISLDLTSDINNDGLADLLIGSPLSDVNGNVESGEAFAVFGADGDGNGSSRVLTSAILDPLDGDNGVRYQSEIAGGGAGSSVAVIGDINNDGFNDFAIGKPGVAGGGEVTIINGVDGSFAGALISDGGVAGAQTDDALSGADATSAASSNIASLGDVNGDDIDDFIIGTPDAQVGGNQNGEAFILFGGDAIDFPTDMATAAGLRFLGGTDDEAGTVAGSGDFNGDGINDILIGSPGANTNGADSGAVLVVFGQADGTWDFGTQFNGATDTIQASDGFVIGGVAAGDALGSELSTIDDFNGDGIDDFAITASGADAGQGAVYIVFGRSDIGMGVDLSDNDSSSHITITGDRNSLGQSISGAGDVNGDMLDDVIIGAENTAYVLYGFSNGAAQTSMAQSVIALDDGILLPDGNDAPVDDMPMDTASSDAGAAQSASMLAAEPVSVADVLVSDDIDLSGLA